MRRAILVVSVAVSACATVPRLQPNPPSEREDQIIATPVMVGVRVLPNAWKGPPDNVAQNFTPIWLHFVNKGDQAWDITYAGLQLIDEAGRTYAAVPPMEVVRACVGMNDVELGPRVASIDSDAPLLGQLGFGFGMGDPYDPGSPYYNPWQQQAASADAARNIVTAGLREGRLLPKTQAMGFVYFQRAYDAKELHVRIEAASEVAGQAPLEMQANFTIAH